MSHVSHELTGCGYVTAFGIVKALQQCRCPPANGPQNYQNIEDIIYTLISLYGYDITGKVLILQIR